MFKDVWQIIVPVLIFMGFVLLLYWVLPPSGEFTITDQELFSEPILL